MSRARSALALALCWAILELRQRQALNPLSRQTIAHNPRIRCALGTPQDAHNLGNSNPLALAYKVHAPTKKKSAQCARKDLRNAAQCAVSWV